MPAPRGTFIWYDVMRNDTKAATEFYSDVIGWDAQEHAMPDNRTYTIFSKGPAMVAGLMAISEESCAEGAKPGWSGYIATNDVDADAAQVVVAGGAIRRPPEDIPNVGRFAVATDPGGAVFLLFKPNTAEEPKPVTPMTPGPRLKDLVAVERSKKREAIRNAPIRSPIAQRARILSVLEIITHSLPTCVYPTMITEVESRF
jgi:predicted enzyme related to lactoylglutathione lyase